MNRSLAVALLAVTALTPVLFAQDARQIMQEVQKRQHSTSQHYEGTLEVIGGGNRIAMGHDGCTQPRQRRLARGKLKAHPPRGGPGQKRAYPG